MSGVSQDREPYQEPRRRRYRRTREALVCLGATVGLVAAGQPAVASSSAAAASAGYEFSSPQTLSDVEAGNPEVVVDSGDRATVVWQAISPDHELRLVQAVRLDPEGVPSPIRTLSSMPNFTHSKWCPCPRAAVDPEDRVTVAWQLFDDDDLRVQAVVLGADGSPGPVQTLSEPGQDALGQRLAVDSKGRATVIWQAGFFGGLMSARLHPDGTVEPAQTLSEAGVGTADVAVDAVGRATVVWRSDEGIRAVRLDADGSPGAIRAISPAGEDAGAPSVAVDSEGRATVAWWRGAGVYEVKAVRLGVDGAPGPVRTLSPEGQNALGPQVVVGPDDRVTLAWEDFDERVNAVQLEADGVPGPVHRLSAEDRVAGDVDLAAGPGGDVAVVWSHPGRPHIIPPFDGCVDAEFEPESDFVRAALIGPDGVPGGPVAVSPLGEQSIAARVAVDSQGRPTVAWSSYDGTYFCWDTDARVQSSRGSEVLDAPAPAPVATPDPPPADIPAPTPPAADAPQSRESTLRLGRWAVAGRRRVAMRAACRGRRGDPCRGVIRVLVRMRAGRLQGRRVGSMPRKVRVTLVARGCYRLAARQRAVFQLRLSQRGRRLLSRPAPRRIGAIVRGQGVERRAVSLVRQRHFAKRRGYARRGRDAPRRRDAAPRRLAVCRR